MREPTIHVVGIGLAGVGSLPLETLHIVQSATLISGAQRHLDAVKRVGDCAVERVSLNDFTQAFKKIDTHLRSHRDPQAVVLASGDPLFFGIGRLLLAAFSPDQLAFYPHVSAIQLAFSQLKLPWQNATLVSVHGRGDELLTKAVRRGDELIAVLTDSVLTPGAIARLIVSLDIPIQYRLWVCENLGSEQTKVSDHRPQTLAEQSIEFCALNVVVLQRQIKEWDTQQLPLIGLPDSAFKGFRDRPTLMTKREIRLLILGELAPLDGEVIWDIGAGTGSVSIELSRLCPKAILYAIEKTAAGASLIEENAQRLAIAPIHIVQGKAPDALQQLHLPHRVFIGGSSGALVPILNFLSQQTKAQRIVSALATLESLSEITNWTKKEDISNIWNTQIIQVSVARSLPVGTLTRFQPSTPITIVSLTRKK